MMKNLTRIILAIIAGTALLGHSCSENNDFILSEQDKDAIDGMSNAYENAKIENATIETALEDADSGAVHTHDSLFHHYEEEFEMHHNNYMHDNEHDDHLHDEQGMHMMGGGGMMHDEWTDGHHSEEHDLMDELVHDHDNMVH